jgi:hypothetical protein
VPKKPGVLKHQYARQALGWGLKLEAELGVNAHTVNRRRLRMKLEFLDDAEAEATPAQKDVIETHVSRICYACRRRCLLPPW